MSALIIPTIFGLLAMSAVAISVGRLASGRPMLPWDYVFALSMLAGLFSFDSVSGQLATPQFLNVAPPSNPEGGSFLTVGSHGIGISSLRDAEVKKLFVTSGGLGGDEECKSHEREIALLNADQRSELIKVLAQVFDPAREGPPPLTTSVACALGIAADLEPLDPALTGPLLTQVAASGFFAGEAARLVMRSSVLPAVVVREELDRLKAGAAPQFLAVLKEVPVDDFAPFAESIASSTGAAELGHLLVLAHSPTPYANVARRIRDIVAAPQSEEQRRAGMIAAANMLPAAEALQLLEPLTRTSDGAATLGVALKLAHNKSIFSPLVPPLIDGWDPFELAGNDTKVEILARFGAALAPSLPALIRKMVLVPTGTADWEKKRHAAAERCYRSLGGSNAPPESSCWPDIAPPGLTSCDGRMTTLSPRLQKIVGAVDPTDPALLAPLRELLADKEPAVREIGVHILGRFDREVASKLLVPLERDPSKWIAAIAFSTERRLDPVDQRWSERAERFLASPDSRRCFGSTAFLQALAGMGEPGVRTLLVETVSGTQPAIAATALAEAESIPRGLGPELLSLFESDGVRRCTEERVIGPLLQAAMKVEGTTIGIDFVRKVLKGDKLACCSELTRLRGALTALAHVAVSNAEARAALKANLSLTARLPGRESEVNRVILASSPKEGRRVMTEIAAGADEERKMANAVRQVRESSRMCLAADGSMYDPVVAPVLGPKSSGQEIAAHFANVAAELDGKGIDSTKGEIERLAATDPVAVAAALERDGPRILALRNANCESLLLVAVRDRKLELLRTLLRFRPELDLRDRSGRTALMRAAEQNDPVSATLLLDAGASMDLHDFGSQYSETALTLAANRQSREVVKLLLERGASETTGRPRVPFELSLLSSDDPELVGLATQRKQGCAR